MTFVQPCYICDAVVQIEFLARNQRELDAAAANQALLEVQSLPVAVQADFEARERAQQMLLERGVRLPERRGGG